MKKKGRGKRKREFENIAGFLVFEKWAHFSDYLKNEVGADWHTIKRTLYDAGYTTAAVNEYRDGLLADFQKLCDDHGFTAWV